MLYLLNTGIKNYFGNAGFIGGTDFSFYKEYTDAVFDFVNNNDIAKFSPGLLLNFNVVFEQVLFYDLCSYRKKTLACLFKNSYNDYGYSYDDVADFAAVPHKKQYLHLIGAHKRNRTACDLMSRLLLNDYPKYFIRITSLFKNQNRRLGLLDENCFALAEENRSTAQIRRASSHSIHFTINKTAIFPEVALMTKQIEMLDNGSAIDPKFKESIRRYETELLEIVQKFDELPIGSLFEDEVHYLQKLELFSQSKSNFLSNRFKRNPNLLFIDTIYDWSLVKNDIGRLKYFNQSIEQSITICCIPSLLFDGSKELAVDDFEYNILFLLADEMSLTTLLNKLK